MIESTDDFCEVSQLHRFFTVVPVLRCSRVACDWANHQQRGHGAEEYRTKSMSVNGRRVDHERRSTCLPGRRAELIFDNEPK